MKRLERLIPREYQGGRELTCEDASVARHQSVTAEQLLKCLDEARLRRHQGTPIGSDALDTAYLGGRCERAIQYRFAKTPVDHWYVRRAQDLRAADRDTLIEDRIRVELLTSGFDISTRKPNGSRLGFSLFDGQLIGAVDGMLLSGPAELPYPVIWMSRCLASETWQIVRKSGLKESLPLVYAQLILAQAHLGASDRPAVFTAVNADTMEMTAEQIMDDSMLAKALAARALRVIGATKAGERLARPFEDEKDVECVHCPWRERCWRSE